MNRDWPRGLATPQADAPWSRLPRAVRDLGKSGRFAMHLLLCILDQPPADAPRWWVASDRARVEGQGGQFDQMLVEAFETPPSPATSWLAIAKDTPARVTSPVHRVVTTTTPGGLRLYVVQYAGCRRWFRVLPSTVRSQLLE